MAGRTSMGRQKIDIKRITDDDARQVTFSKRRLGIFKKASELCTLCGAEVAIVVFSPAGKAFSFGHPCVDTLLNQYLTGTPPEVVDATQHFLQAHRGATIRELNKQYTEVNNELEAEKKRGEELHKMRKKTLKGCWWDAPIEDLNLHELQKLKVTMEELKKNIAKRTNEVMIQGSSSSSSISGANPAGGADTFVNYTTVPPSGYNFGYGNRFY